MRRPVLALIPARGGSRGLQGKNMQLLGGHPLLAWAVAAAQAAGCLRVVVSSEHDGILEVAERYGAEALKRPADLASNTAGDAGVIHHARQVLGWEGGCVLAYLRPTTPLRDPALLVAALRVLEAEPLARALRSVHLAPESPLKWYRADERGALQPVNRAYVDAPRQTCPPVWVPNGYVDLVRWDHWSERVVGFAVHGLEFDTLEQLAYIRWVHSQTPSPLQGMLDDRRGVRATIGFC